jgi:type II secretory pathway pseudopilin PulG
MLKSNKGVTFVEIMIAILISAITISSAMAFFVKMYGIRYFNVAELYYLDFAMSTLEYRKCYGAQVTAATLLFPLGRQKTIGIGKQEEYMAWCVNHNISQTTFPKISAGNQTVSLIKTEFTGGYPYTNANMQKNAFLSNVINNNAREIEYPGAGANTLSVKNFILTGVPKPDKTIKLLTFYLNDAFVIKAVS